MWFIGFVAFIIASYKAYEKTGFVNAFLILAGLYILGFILLRKLTALKWQKAKEALDELKSGQKNPLNDTFFFRNLKQAFFIPNYLNTENAIQYMLFGKLYSVIYKKWFSKPHVTQHYLDFIEIFRNFVKPEEYNKYLSILNSNLQKLKDSKKFYFEAFMFENVMKLIKIKERQLTKS